MVEEPQNAFEGTTKHCVTTLQGRSYAKSITYIQLGFFSCNKVNRSQEDGSEDMAEQQTLIIMKRRSLILVMCTHYYQEKSLALQLLLCYQKGRIYMHQQIFLGKVDNLVILKCRLWSARILGFNFLTRILSALISYSTSVNCRHSERMSSTQ